MAIFSDYLSVFNSGKFWSASEGDTFELPVVALAIGVGRNDMSQIPVKRFVINKRNCYKKSDILDWLELEQARGEGSLLEALRLKRRNQINKDKYK